MLRRLKLVTGGESHGPGLTILLTGMPAGLAVDFDLIQSDLARRQHGYGRGRRMQIERDSVEVRGGVRDGETLGSPIALWVENRDWKNWRTIMAPHPDDTDAHMSEMRRIKAPRPGHVDLASSIKYGRRDPRDVLERASARETTGRVAAGAFAKMLLAEVGVEIKSGVRFLGHLGADRPVPDWQDLQGVVEDSPLRAIHRDLEDDMVALVDRAQEEGETLGGAVTVIAHDVPLGLGSHVQWDDKLDGRLAQAVMSVPAVKGVEIGAAVAVSQGMGSEAHDAIGYDAGGETMRQRWPRPTNHAGGSEGGVTNGADVVITAYKKPISTLRKGMQSVDLDSLEPHASTYERSDVTALPAAGVIAESMVALVLADALLEKVGGDSVAEMRTHWAATLARQVAWPGGLDVDEE